MFKPHGVPHHGGRDEEEVRVHTPPQGAKNTRDPNNSESSENHRFTASEGILATDEPKFARMMKASFARRRSADLAMWDTFTEPHFIPKGAIQLTALHSAPYQTEIHSHKQPRTPRSIIGLPMIRPEGKTAWRWKTFIGVVDMTYTAFLVPLSFTFFHDVRISNWMSVFDIIGGMMYVVDVIMNFHIGIVLTRAMQARLVLNGRLVAWLYIRRSTFVLDIIASLPVWPELVLVIMGTTGGNLKTIAEITTWLRLTRMFRLLPLLQSLAVLSLTGYHSRRLLRYMPASVLLLCHMGYMFLFLANFLTNLWAYTAIAEGRENSWMQSVGSNQLDISGASNVTQYVAALYYVVTTLTTTGYGDISAATSAERIVAIVIMVIGIAFFGFLLTVLQNIIQHGSVEGRRSHMFRKKIGHVERWMDVCEMPIKLRAEIRDFYAEVYIRHEEVDEEDMYNALPHHLRGEVTSYFLDGMLQKSDAFGSLDVSGRLLVAAMLKPVSVAPGHTLFPQRGPAENMFILQDGELAMYRNTIEIAVVTAPYLTGQLSVLNACEPDGESPYKHFFACRAVTLCMVWKLSLEDLIPLANVRPRLKEALLRETQRVMKLWGAQQPDDSCWSDAADKAAHHLQKLKELEASHPPTTKANQEEKLEETHRDNYTASASKASKRAKQATKQRMPVVWSDEAFTQRPVPPQNGVTTP